MPHDESPKPKSSNVLSRMPSPLSEKNYSPAFEAIVLEGLEILRRTDKEDYSGTSAAPSRGPNPSPEAPASSMSSSPDEDLEEGLEGQDPETIAGVDALMRKFGL